MLAMGAFVAELCLPEECRGSVFLTMASCGTWVLLALCQWAACLLVTIGGGQFLVIICVGGCWDGDVFTSQVFTDGFWFLIADAYVFLMLMSENLEAYYTYYSKMLVGS